MHRFFSPVVNISENKITVSDKNQVHHIRDVLRLKAEDKIILFDDKGTEYGCIIEELSGIITLSIKNIRIFSNKIKEIRLTIACAIPKKSKMEDIIDKLTQLGVDKIVPLLTERVIIKMDRDKKVSRQARWQKVALSAAQQSQRNIMPILEPVKTLNEILSDSRDYDLKLIPTLLGERKLLKKIITMSKPRNILVLVGPEGDFTPREVNLAKKYGFIPVSLGALVLRVETAAVALASFIKFYENS